MTLTPRASLGKHTVVAAPVFATFTGRVHVRASISLRFAAAGAARDAVRERFGMRAMAMFRPVGGHPIQFFSAEEAVEHFYSSRTPDG
jgi:hypothetical protein